MLQEQPGPKSLPLWVYILVGGDSQVLWIRIGSNRQGGGARKVGILNGGQRKTH